MRVLKNDRELRELGANAAVARNLWLWVAGLEVRSYDQLRQLTMTLGPWGQLPPSEEYWNTVHSFYAKASAGRETTRLEQQAAMELRNTFKRYFTDMAFKEINDAKWDTDDDE